MKKLLCTFGIVLAFAGLGFAQGGGFGGGNQGTDDHNDSGPTQVGYAVITPSTTNFGLSVMETFGLKSGGENRQTGFDAPDLVTSATLFADVSDRLGRNLGVAITNPSGSAVSVVMTLRKNDGTTLGTRTIVLQGRAQTAQFVTALVPTSSTEYTGTLFVTANTALSIVGIRFRGLNFGTVPVTIQGSTGTLPTFSSGVGGSSAFLLPQFAEGGGWATQIVISNTNSSAATVRVDLFKQDGTPLTATLNHTTSSSFQSLSVPANGTLVLSPRDANGDDRF